MSARPFRSFQTRFSTVGLSAMFAPRKPRHPLLRVLLGVIGIVLLAALLVVGLVVGTAMLAGGLMLRLVRQRGNPATASSRVVDAEYHVVKPGQPILR